jgi:primosomal protein N' (replication factor Y)
MYIIDVIPLALIPRNQTQILSYFNNEPISQGAVVEVALGTRKIKAVVISSDPIKNQKLIFKKNVDFKLKNIIRIINPEPQVSNWQLHIANYISSYYYAPLGICLKTVLPPFWGKRGYKINITEPKTKPEKISDKFEFIKSDLKNHSDDYAGIIKEQLKLGKKVFLMVPENTAAQYFLERFSELKPLFISGGLSNKKFYEVWNGTESDEPCLIIGTRIGLFLPFSNLGVTIVDDESNEFYKSDMMPRYSAVEIAIEIAREHGAKLIIGDNVPRLETYSKISEFIPASKSPGPGRSDKIINMVDEIKNANYSIFSRLLKQKIIDNESHLILYVPHRGHANFILCQKCGKSIKCPNCTTSLVLHKEFAGVPATKLLCHHCNYQIPEPKSCPGCGSFQLKPYGIGTEKVVEELKKLEKSLERASVYNKNITAKKINVFRLDSDISQNLVEKEMKILDDFRKTKSSILVTTQIIFSYKYLLNAPIIGIINADTLINIPDFRAEEYLFKQIYNLGQMGDSLIIQTHNPEDEAIKLASLGSLQEFMKQELESRKTFAYPPFAQFVKLSYRHKNPAKARSEARILFEKLKIALAPGRTGGQASSQMKTGIQILSLSPAFISKEHGNYIWNVILKSQIQISNNKTEERKNRNEFLRFVPPGWTIDVDPKNII